MTAGTRAERWDFTLYIDGASMSSLHAIEEVRRVCDQHLGGQADVEIIDLHQQPELGRRDRVVVVPTLIRKVPGPPRRFVGELSDSAWRSLGLDLGPAGARDRSA